MKSSRVLVLLLLSTFAAASPAAAVVPEGGFSAGPVPEAQAAPPPLAAVIELLKKGDAASALKGAFTEALRLEPGRLSAMLRLGRLAMETRQFTKYRSS